MGERKTPTCPEHKGKFKAGCQPCRAWGAWHARQRKKHGPHTVDIQPVQAHVRALMKAGMRVKDIEARSGVSVQPLLYGHRKRTNRDLAAAVLAVTGPDRPVGPLRGRDLLDATGTRRRVRALARLGWTTAAMGEEAGISAKCVQDLMSGMRKWVRPATAAAVAAAYARLELQVGASRWAAVMAESKGWAPPLAWDDIDDPRARPRGAGKGPGVADEATVLRLMRGEKVRSRPADRREAIRRLAAERMRHEDIAARLHVRPKTVTTSLRRQRRRGVAA